MLNVELWMANATKAKVSVLSKRREILESPYLNGGYANIR